MAQLALFGGALGLLWAWARQPPTQDIEIAGSTYTVLRDTPECMQETAAYLAQIGTSLRDFIAAHCATPHTSPESILCRVADRWDGRLRETDVGAYTIDKTRISMCVRHPRTRELQRWDTCVFVALHELAHIANAREGHPQRFWQDLGTLVGLAKSYGILDPKGVGACYCGAPAGRVPESSATRYYGST